MKWNKILDFDEIRKQVPLEEPFIALYQDVFCLVEFNQFIDCFFYCCYPGKLKQVKKIPSMREKYMTHWMKIEDLNLEK